MKQTENGELLIISQWVKVFVLHFCQEEIWICKIIWIIWRKRTKKVETKLYEYNFGGGKVETMGYYDCNKLSRENQNSFSVKKKRKKNMQGKIF